MSLTFATSIGDEEEGADEVEAQTSWFGSAQYVSSFPFPFATTTSSLYVSQCFLPDAISKPAVAADTWILPGVPVASILDAVLTVSPKSWNLQSEKNFDERAIVLRDSAMYCFPFPTHLPFSPRSTPAVTERLKHGKNVF